MLQIIGWILCLMLFAKGIEFVTSNAYRSEDRVNVNSLANGVGGLCIIGALLMGFFLYQQGKAMERVTGSLFGGPDAALEAAKRYRPADGEAGALYNAYIEQQIKADAESGLVDNASREE